MIKNYPNLSDVCVCIYIYILYMLKKNTNHSNIVTMITFGLVTRQISTLIQAGIIEWLRQRICSEPIKVMRMVFGLTKNWYQTTVLRTYLTLPICTQEATNTYLTLPRTYLTQFAHKKPQILQLPSYGIK